jgi:hypothetical protein
LEKIVEKVCIRGCEVSKILAIAFGDQQDVQRIAGPGMLESQSGRGFVEAADRDGKGHVNEKPGKKDTKWTGTDEIKRET